MAGDLQSREKFDTPPSPFWTRRHFFRGGGGVYISKPPGQGILCPPPSFIHCPPLEGSFQGWGVEVCKIWPCIKAEWPTSKNMPNFLFLSNKIVTVHNLFCESANRALVVVTMWQCSDDILEKDSLIHGCLLHVSCCEPIGLSQQWPHLSIPHKVGLTSRSTNSLSLVAQCSATRDTVAATAPVPTQF